MLIVYHSSLFFASIKRCYTIQLISKLLTSKPENLFVLLLCYPQKRAWFDPFPVGYFYSRRFNKV